MELRTPPNTSGSLVCHGFGKKRERPRKIAGLAAPSLRLKPQMAAEPNKYIISFLMFILTVKLIIVIGTRQHLFEHG